jgi:murein DD-endopeptidase MepM/ murein hydrolase activator NlpD
MRPAPWIFAFLAAFIAGAAAAGTPVRQGFDIAVPVEPAPVHVGEADHLVYELHLTSFASAPLTLTGIEVIDAATGTVLEDFDAEALDSRVAQVGAGPNGGDPRVVAPGMRNIVYIDVALHGDAPAKLGHRIQFDAVVDGAREHASVEGGRVAVDARPLPRLGPPLRGGPWVAVYDPAMARGHRRVVYAVDGKARIPGRFAIDWFGVDDKGNQISRSDGSETSDWRGYGADVLAVADATVVATRDNFEEPAEIAGRSRPAIGDATGNYIALDIGGGRFAFYEHLKPGLLVKPGDRVRRGQVIASLGFTGQTMTPHLHFHVADANSALAAEGVPFHFDRYRRLGAYSSIAAFGRKEPWRAEPTVDRMDGAFPAANEVVQFPDK